MDNDQSLAAEREQRMLAVAKLKRAASLPRLKDGRRPPMHNEAVKRQVEVAAENNEDTGEAEAEVEDDNRVEDLSVTPPPTRSKRRSRSRSRSRGSRDFKGKARALQSPTPSSLNQGDSSQDEAFVPSPIAIPVIPHLISPIPSQVQRSMLLRSPTPENSLFQYPGTSPPTPTPLPTLEAIQKGLFRSHSVGRMMAMHKLTGGTDTYEPSPSPTPPISGKFRRTNTISGGERSAARKKLMDTLGSRSKMTANNTDVELVSGPEEPPIAPSPSPTPNKRRRRRRRSSSGAAAITNPVSDSDWASTSANTPQVPPTPLPPSSLDFYPDLPSHARSTTPNQPPSSRSYSPRIPSPFAQVEVSRTPPQPPLNGAADRERPERPRRRSVVVEEEEEEQQMLTSSNVPPLPRASPQLLHNGYASRTPHSSDDPSDISNEYTTSVGVPVYLSDKEPSRDGDFPISPFGTPLKERPLRDEEEEEKVLYPADTSRDRSMYENEFEREISWVASPVPEIRMPIHDDDDDGDEDDYGEEQEYEERAISPQLLHGLPDAYDDTSPRASSDSQNLGLDSEISPDGTPSYVPPSPSSVAALSGTASIPRESDGSMSPQSYPARLSIASRVPGGERSPLSADFGDLDDRPMTNDASKRSGDSATTSTWEKVKNTFRSNSSLGRRSRSNSIVNSGAARDRRDQTDSSISRESRSSLTSPRLDKTESTSTSATQQGQPPMLSPSASNSILSLSPTPGSRSGASPVPPPLSVDLSKYQNAKLFPFPGMKQLQEERNRMKGLHSASASTPDINALLNSPEEGSSSSGGPRSGTPLTQTTPGILPRSLTQQTSDSNLGKYFAPPLSAGHSSQSSHPDYFTITPSPSTPNGNTIKLPTTLPGVKQWLSKNKKLFGSQGSSPTSPAISPPAHENGNTTKKPSLTDLLRIRRDNELGTDWEELGNTPTDTSANIYIGKPPKLEDKGRDHVVMPMTPPANSPVPHLREGLPEVEKTPKAQRVMSPIAHDDGSRLPQDQKSPSLPSPPEPVSSTTPDPSSSLSDYPAHSTSDSSSTTSSRYSTGGFSGPIGPVVLQQLDEQLPSLYIQSPAWTSAIDTPERKLVLSSPVLQVVNANTVKDRFLFLFSDILVIAKPVIKDEDAVFDKPTPERNFTVKSVIQLRNLRLDGDRNVSQNRSSGLTAVARNPILRAFVHQFAKDPDHAISTLFSKTGISDDPVFLGQLVFNTIELDRAQLGTYLSQRTSKLVLKSYLDSFGFVGLRVDRALRAFLISLHVPSRSVNNHSALEYLLDAFASRWYEANARFIAYDKDLAIRLVRGLNQLNDLLHGGLASEPGKTGLPRRNITARDFTDAFRRCDPKYTVSDELLEDIYQSIREERLSHARDAQATETTDTIITIKRPLPPRLTYKVQSEPIVLRIPQQDPHLQIHLYGQDLVIDPPVLTFTKSSEAAFRVTGTSLGPKTIIIRRSGPNALIYSGLPPAQRITIERAFMRNTFQVAFMNHTGTKRRYMFSVDDPLVRHQWLVSLRRQIDIAASSVPIPLSSAAPGAQRLNRAIEIIAFKVLQETLIGQEACAPGPARVMEEAIQRLNTSFNGSPRLGSDRSPSRGQANGSRIAAPLHIRSKSRSKVYHRSKAGRNEMDIGMNRLDAQDSLDTMNGTKSGSSPGSSNQQTSTHSDSPTWSGQDLVMHCLQNSSIPLILSYLQAGEQAGRSS
uniref:SEC7 domain-containing protein n=1 Tax=Moniliophthora roreri TaxID=221103 RepID=A0A0W0FH86_MONRR